MNQGPMINRMTTGATLVFAFLAVAFWFNLWGHLAPQTEYEPTDPVFTNTATVRLSAQELIDLGEDTSGMDCSACHEPGDPVELHFDEQTNIILPLDHQDLVYSRMNCVACHLESEEKEMEWDDDGNVIIPVAHRLEVLRHGDNRRNNDCFNCHHKEDLSKLNLRSGRLVEFTETTLLCSECHGPTTRAWEDGLHGRTEGYWDTTQGEALRKECTSCHDPHHPRFPEMLTGPAPNYYRAEITRTDHPEETEDE
jgi:hypothetical protein